MPFYLTRMKKVGFKFLYMHQTTTKEVQKILCPYFCHENIIIIFRPKIMYILPKSLNCACVTLLSSETKNIKFTISMQNPLALCWTIRQKVFYTYEIILPQNCPLTCVLFFSICFLLEDYDQFKMKK